jgi:hypothetical protein
MAGGWKNIGVQLSRKLNVSCLKDSSIKLNIFGTENHNCLKNVQGMNENSCLERSGKHYTGISNFSTI